MAKKNADSYAEDYAGLPLAERHKREREFYLGQTDVNPATGKTVAEERSEHAEAIAKADEELKTRTAKLKADGETIVEGVGSPVPEDALPTEADLKRMGKNDVVEQANREGLDVAGVEDKAVIIDAIIANRNPTE